MQIKSKENKGFSIVELVVVVVLIAILVGVTIGGIFSYINKSRINMDIRTAKEIEDTLQPLLQNDDIKGSKFSGTFNGHGRIVELTWNEDKSEIPKFKNDIELRNGPIVVIDPHVVTTAVSKYLNELPAPKSGGYFKIAFEYSKDGYDILNMYCKAYSSDNKELVGKE